MSSTQSRGFSPCRMIGLAGAMTVIIGAIVAGGGAQAFIHIPSIVFLFGITFFILLATFGADFLRFIPQSLLTFVSYHPQPNPRFAEIALFASRSVMGVGLLGLLIGLVQMLQNLSNPADLGAGMAVALLTVFYAVVISEVFCAFLYRAYSDRRVLASNKVLPLRSAATAALATTLTLIVFFVLLTSFAGPAL